MLLSPCRGFMIMSGREDSLGSEWVLTTKSAVCCTLVNVWVWLRSLVCLLRQEVDFG